MRIAFDARPLVGRRTGVGVWLEGLLRGLATSGQDELVLCLPRRGGDLGLGELGNRTTRLVSALPLPGTVWLHTLAGPSLAGRADVFIATLGILPRRVPIPAVVVVHDLTPRTRPHHHRLANRYCFNAYFEESVLRADVVVCDSEATRKRLAEVLPRQAAEARVVSLAVDPFYCPGEPDEPPAPTQEMFARGRPFVVQLGTLEPRKGLATLVDAHAALLRQRPQGPDLVLAGAPGWADPQLERALASHPDQRRIHRPGYVSREQARALLRHAEVVVLAAEEEGFGLPLAEAMACGACCLASDEPALIEVGGTAVRYFPRGDSQALAVTLMELLDARDRPALRSAALLRAQELGWASVIAAWRSLLAGLRMPRDAAPRH